MVEQLNVNLDSSLARDLSIFMEGRGMTKTAIVTNALRQYIAIKEEEDRLHEEHPYAKLRTKVVIEKKIEGKGAEQHSLMIY